MRIEKPTKSRFRELIQEDDEGGAALAGLLRADGRAMVLTGAGCSTNSGIPDYRDPAGEWKHARPVQFGDFMASEAVRRRYWARSLIGWPRMAGARPNGAHHAIASLQRAGRVERLVTQNVDGLHQKAGSEAVIDLHGRIDGVACMQCGASRSRADWQSRIAAMNPGWESRAAGAGDAPDGDARLEGADYGGFVVPACPDCGGIVKPSVVFFGEAVPAERVRDAMAALERAGALVVVGSSLMVFSGFRFARRAAELGKPVAIVNRGRTRADELATLKIDADCESVLGAAVESLRGAARE